MGVSSYLEFITVLFGWVMYDNIWTVLADTGIVYVPFIVVVLRNVMDSRRGGDDEGPAALQSLKKSETDVVVGLAVMMLAAVPFSEVQLAEMSYPRPTLDCAREAAMAAGTEPTVIAGGSGDMPYSGTVARLSGEVGRIPIWWGFVHTLSKAVVSASLAAIPCSHDVVGVATRLGGTRLDDQLVSEISRFKFDCHKRAVSCVGRPKQCGWSIGLMERFSRYRGTEYIGFRKFVDTDEFYPSFHAQVPVPGFEPDPDGRDRGRQEPGAYPTCAEWWDDAAMGIRGRLIASVDEEVKQRLVYAADSKFRTEIGGSDQRVWEDAMLDEMLADAKEGQYGGMRRGSALSFEPGYGEIFRGAENWARGLEDATGELLMDVGSGIGATIGMIVKAPGQSAAGMIVREGMPMFVALLMMVFVAILPVLMVFSRYDPGTVLVLTLIFFGMQFVYVLWGMAFWVDQHLFEAWGGISAGPLRMAILLWVQRFLYLIFPMIWLVGLGWIGVRGSDVAFSGAVQSPTAGSAQVGEAGGDIASSAATKAAGKAA